MRRFENSNSIHFNDHKVTSQDADMHVKENHSVIGIQGEVHLSIRQLLNIRVGLLLSFRTPTKFECVHFRLIRKNIETLWLCCYISHAAMWAFFKS